MYLHKQHLREQNEISPGPSQMHQLKLSKGFASVTLTASPHPSSQHMHTRSPDDIACNWILCDRR